jgi:hypothetical protein
LKIVSLSGISCLGSSFYGSARIVSSSQPIAVSSATAYTYNGAFSLSEVDNGSGQTNIVYAPLIQNYNYNWISGSAIQNAYGSTNTLSAIFYNQSGSQCLSASYPGIGAYYSHVNTAPPGGVCTTIASAIFSGGTHNVEAIVNQLVQNSSYAGDYRAVTNPGQTVVLPLWYNQVLD